MAANRLKYPLGQAAKRGFAAQAAAKVAETSAPEVICTVLPNKLMVSSMDTCGPLTRVSVAFKFGSRNETDKNYGMTHLVRSMTGFSTSKFTTFAIMRNLQHEGVHFTCTGDREITSFNIVAARDKIENAFKYLSSVISSPAFKPWQIKDNNPRLHYEIGCLTPKARLIDMLHSAAFRTGLGNSLFIKKYKIGTYSSEMLQSFYKTSFTANRASVSGINIESKVLLEFAKSLELQQGTPSDGNGTYYGGELRKNTDSYFANIAIATQGAGVKDLKEALTFAVLQYAYGARPVVAWGGSPSPIYKAVYPEAPEAGVSCFSINYSDTGLFGFVLSSYATTAGKALESAFKVIKSGSVSDADVKRAKALLKMNLLSDCESSENLIDDFSGQSLYTGVIIPGPVLAEAIDKICTADVVNAAKKVASGKFSLVGFGNLEYVPYLDQLK